MLGNSQIKPCSRDCLLMLLCSFCLDWLLKRKWTWIAVRHEAAHVIEQFYDWTGKMRLIFIAAYLITKMNPQWLYVWFVWMGKRVSVSLSDDVREAAVAWGRPAGRSWTGFRARAGGHNGNGPRRLGQQGGVFPRSVGIQCGIGKRLEVPVPLPPEWRRWVRRRLFWLDANHIQVCF